MCQQVGFLKMEWKEKRRFCLTLLPQSGWLHQHATKVPCLAFLLVWPLSSICRTCHRIIQNTSTSQCLTAKCHDLLPPFFTCCPLHLSFEISTSLGGGSPPSPMKITGAPEKCGGHSDCQCGWMVCGSIGILCQVSAAWQMRYVGSEVNLGEGRRPSSNPKEFVWEFQNV